MEHGLDGQVPIWTLRSRRVSRWLRKSSDSGRELGMKPAVQNGLCDEDRALERGAMFMRRKRLETRYAMLMDDSQPYVCCDHAAKMRQDLVRVLRKPRSWTAGQLEQRLLAGGT